MKVDICGAGETLVHLQSVQKTVSPQRRDRIEEGLPSIIQIEYDVRENISFFHFPSF